MADTTVFDQVAEHLEQSTSFDRLEARGTLRIALKEAGFDAKTVRVSDLRVVIERVLPGELTARGIEDSGSIVARLASSLDAVHDSPEGESPESVFRRLGGGE